MAELVNVLSGNLLTEQFGTEEIFDLTPPVVHTVNADDAKKFFNFNHSCFTADNEPIGIGCRLDGVE